MTEIRIDTFTILVPLTLRRHGGRKLVIVPEGEGVPVRAKPTPDDTLLKALARAHRWKRMLESGQVRSLGAGAAANAMCPTAPGEPAGMRRAPRWRHRGAAAGARRRIPRSTRRRVAGSRTGGAR